MCLIGRRSYRDYIDWVMQARCDRRCNLRLTNILCKHHSQHHGSSTFPNVDASRRRGMIVDTTYDQRTFCVSIAVNVL